MNHTRTGKIARLPKVIREVLGDRLEQGHPAADLVHWLNGLACVQESLAEYFGGRPITEQNLSEWRAGGHQDWLRHEEARRQVVHLAEQGDDLAEAANGQELSDRLARRLAVEVMRFAETLLAQETDPVQGWARLREINHELSRLRRDDQQTTRLRLQERKIVLAEDEPQIDIWNRRGREERDRRSSPMQSRLVFSDLERDARESGKKHRWQKFHQQDAAIAAAGRAATTPEAPLPADPPETPGSSPEAVCPDPAPQIPAQKSDPIQPDPTKSNPTAKKTGRPPQPPIPGLGTVGPRLVAIPATPSQPTEPTARPSVPVSSHAVNGEADLGAEVFDKNVPSSSLATDLWTCQTEIQPVAFGVTHAGTASSSTPALAADPTPKPLQILAHSPTTSSLPVKLCHPPSRTGGPPNPHPAATP